MYLSGVRYEGERAVTGHHSSNICEGQHTKQSIWGQRNLDTTNYTDCVCGGGGGGKGINYYETESDYYFLPVFAKRALMTHCMPTRNMKY